LGPLDPDSVDPLHVSAAIADELLGHDTVFAGIPAHMRLDLRVAIVYTVDSWPLWPGVVSSSLGRGLGEEFEICNRFRSMADTSTNAVITSVPAADNDNMLISGANVVFIIEIRIDEGLRL